MSGYALLTLNVIGGLLILVALVTPGWFGLDMDTSTVKIKVAVSIFYSKVCLSSDSLGTVECTTISNVDAASRSISTSRMSDKYAFRFTEFMVEGAFALFCIGVGTVLTAFFAKSVINRGSNNQSHLGFSSNGTAGLVFIIIGGICGGILCIDTIVAHVRMNDVMDEVASYRSTLTMKKVFPYSIVIMSIGLFLEFSAGIVQIACTRSKPRSDTEIILSPAVNAPSVVVQSSTTSSVPYSKFA